ncbi:MAG: hypothetical protein AAF432_12640 [Planctomycetota bacterium]
MNSGIMRWLLDLDVIPADAERLALVWERGWPPWVWALLVLAAFAFAIWSYSRMAGPRSIRGTMACVRGFILLLVLVLLSGPMLQMKRERIEEDWVIALLDRSASMSIADVDVSTNRRTRDTQLREMIRDHADMFASLDESRHLVWLGFDDGAYTLIDSAGDELPIDLSLPDGDRTNLNTAIEQALQRATARPISGVVVFSDGRTNDPPTRSLVRRLQADAIPVFAVPLGASESLGDIAVRRVEAPRRAFVRDKVPVVVEVDRLGEAAQQARGTVKLVDTDTGDVLDEQSLDASDDMSSITLTAVPELAGDASWQVVVETDRPDLIPDNNLKPFRISLVDRPLRVLFVEGYPRWEYRYLKNLLIREKSIESSAFLLSADRDFAQEGNTPITRLPRSPEEFAEFDVIVMGDVPASFFSPDQLDMIRQQVADRGSGLLWIGGERSTPSSYVGNPLADLLPMRGPLTLSRIDDPVNMMPTEQANRLGILRLATNTPTGWPADLSDPAFNWSQLYYAQRIEPSRLKPAAEVLASTTQAFDGLPLPLVVGMRYGAGQTIYVATDEIWRWRFGRGELYPDQFWVQMIRSLGRQSLATSGAPAVLEVNPRRVRVDQPVRIELSVLDARLESEDRTSITVTLEDEQGRAIADLELVREDDRIDRYVATYVPHVTGQLRVRLDDPSVNLAAMDAVVEVFAPDDELRRPEADHDLLASLTSTTGGDVIDADELTTLPDRLRKRAVRIENPLNERIWDTPLAFLLLLLGLTAEWIGRRVLRLA